MFDYPLPIPATSLYDELGVSPTASDQEVLDAKAEVTGRLGAESNALQVKLKEVLAKVEGLAEAEGDLQALRDQGVSAPADALRKAERHAAKLLARAAVLQPELPEWRERKEEVDGKVIAINAAQFDKPEAREKYDAQNPPFSLLEIVAPADPLADPKTSLLLLRREVSAFLARAGVPVLHPSDLTRDDFTGDFTPIPDLDGN